MLRSASTSMSRSRLIRAEQLATLAGGGAAPWAFERMDAPPPLIVVEEEEQGPPPEPPIDIEVLLAQARAEAFAEGHAAGTNEAETRARQEMQALVENRLQDQAERFAALVDEARQGLEEAQQDIARGTLDIACALARQVLRQELATRPGLLEAVVREAVDLLVADGRSVRVVLSTEDQAWLGGALEQEFASRGVAVVAEAAMAPGDCRLESAGAVVDGGIAPRWARAVASLGLTVPWDAPMPAAGAQPASAGTASAAMTEAAAVSPAAAADLRPDAQEAPAAGAAPAVSEEAPGDAA